MRSLTISLSALCLLACGPSEPAKYGPAKNDGVAANSASETRLAVGEQATTNVTPSASAAAPPPAPAGGDPNAMLAALGGTPGTAAPADPSTSAPSTTSGKTPAAAGKGGKTTGKASSADTASGKPTPAECKQTVDKYIDLMVANDPRFAGIPPEMLAQIKQSGITQATQKSGDPCADGKVTRAQYNCAMSATTTAAWQTCMK